MAQVSLRRLPDVPEIFRESAALGNLAEKKNIWQKITSCNRHYLFSALKFDVAQCATPLGDGLLFCGSLHALGFPQDAFFFRHFFFVLWVMTAPPPFGLKRDARRRPKPQTVELMQWGLGFSLRHVHFVNAGKQVVVSRTCPLLFRISLVSPSTPLHPTIAQ